MAGPDVVEVRTIDNERTDAARVAATMVALPPDGALAPRRSLAIDGPLDLRQPHRRCSAQSAVIGFRSAAELVSSPGTLSADSEGVNSTITEGGRLLGLRVLQYTFVFLGGLIVARALGPSGRAEYALPLNLAMICWVGCHLSVEAVAARLLARGEETYERMARLCSLATLVLGSAGAIATLAIGLLLRDEALGGASSTSVVLAAATVPFTVAAQLATALMLRRGRTRFYGWVGAVVAVGQFALLLVASVTGWLDPQQALAINLVAIAASAAILVGAIGRELGWGSLRPRVPGTLAARALRLGLVLHPSSIALFLNLRIDLLLVGVLLTAHQAGLYSLATVLGELVFVVAQTIALAALRHQTHLADDAAVDYTVDFIRQTFGLTIALVLMCLAGAYPFITLVYGAEWTGTVAPFMLLSLAAAGLAVEGPARGLLFRVARPRDISLAASAAALINLGLNLVLIPPLGISGAALASVCSYWFAAAAMLLLLRQSTGASVRRALGRPERDDLLPSLLRRYIFRQPGGPRCAA
jgi:O-antigen/teichoic acid export membrane protein